MTNYGLPLDFRQVSKNDGSIIQEFSLTGDKGFLLNSQSNSSAIYQFTGRTDANGQKVFIGDLIMSLNSMSGAVYRVELYEDEIIASCINGDEIGIKIGKPPETIGKFIDIMIIIGNVHTPKDQIKQIAQGGGVI